MNQSTVSCQAAVIEAYRERYGESPMYVIIAPGRVNLIGEHTDYNEGFVLPCAIGFATYVAIGRPTTLSKEEGDTRVEAVALDYEGESSTISLNEPINLPRRLEVSDDSPSKTRWSDYVRGVIEVLRDQGHALQSAAMVISGDVPQGAGLSSSASLQVAVGFALSSLFDWGLTPTELALIAQRAENEYVGCQCGIMDQLASAHGAEQRATLIDCRDLRLDLIPLPSEVAIIIIHSGVKRGLVDSEYNTRRMECEEAARTLGVTSLREVSESSLIAHQQTLSEKVYRRARHVITENQRTLAAAEALAQGDLKRLGELMYASHASLANDYEVTVPPLDLIVELIQSVIGEEGGARMTGGGFGGCVVALTPHANVPAIKAIIESQYTLRTDLEARLFVCKASGGARALTVSQ